MGTARIAAVVGLVALAGAAVTGIATAGPAHHGASSSRSRPNVASVQLVTLAGSARWLIDTQSPASTVDARSASGAVTTVSATRTADDGWSIAANVLSAERPYSPSHPARPSTVDWWNLKTAAHGAVTLNKDAVYVASAPGGFFFISAHRNLDRRNTPSGHRTSYGKSLAKDFYRGVAGPAGLLVSKSLAVKYVTYAHPNHIVTLNVPANGGEPTDCSAVGSVGATDAVCYRFEDGDDERTPVADVLAPLDGGKPTISTTCPGIPAVSGQTMLWAEGSQPVGSQTTCGPPSSTIDSLGAGAASIERSLTVVMLQYDEVGRDLPSAAVAYGTAVFVDSDGTAFIAATSADSISPL